MYGGQRRRRSGRSRRRSCGWAPRARIHAASSPPTNTRASQIWRLGHNTIHGDTSTETLEGVAYREMRRGGGGGRVGVEEDDAAGLLDAGVPRGEVDRIERVGGCGGRGCSGQRGGGLPGGGHGRRRSATAKMKSPGVFSKSFQCTRRENGFFFTFLRGHSLVKRAPTNLTL